MTVAENENLCNYLQIKQAAALIGVTPTTLRNWERTGKLIPRRHPLNRYRLYRRTELEAILNQIRQSPRANSVTGPGDETDAGT